MTELLHRFAGLISNASPAQITTDPSLGGELVLARQDPYTISFAPFGHVNPQAKVVLLGLTPGRQQAVNALLAARRSLTAGLGVEAASKAAKESASFSGPMRQALVDMLDSIGLHDWLGVRSSLELFNGRADIVHFTSALRYPVYVDGKNYSGDRKITSHPLLRGLVSRCLGDEVSRLQQAVWVPLGPWPAATLRMLAEEGKLDRSRILDGVPHPSGANNERIAYFLGRKPRELLSAKTDAERLDSARASLVSRVARLTA